ncbi:hypothetical protein QJQ45_013136 [Haematococcus lacustris]|nr:hypothetical protein QJQ45_013136 [Haematococcus lacustris]
MEHSNAARQQCPRLEEQLAVGVSVLNLLHWGYRNVLIDSSSVTSHKKLYKGDCEFVRLDLQSFCNIVKAKLHAVTSGVTMPAGDAMLVRTTTAVGEADPTGNKMPITTEAQINARYAIKMPDVMCQAVINLTERHGVVPEVLTQACSYCQEKGWRFTFITSYQYTFFVWRVAEDRYAVTDGLLHDAAPHDLYTREVLAYIIWMSLEAPWGRQLPPGELHDLEVLLKQQAPVTVLHGRPQVQQSQVQQDQVQQDQLQQSQVQQDQVQQGSNQLQQTPTAPLHALWQRDQPAPWVTIEDALEYPPESLQLSSMRLGAGQCGPVVQGWLQEVPVAIKATDACKSPDIVQMLWHEAKIYEFLQDLQGHLLPVLHGCGYWSGRNNFFLATAVVPGKPINSCKGVAGAQATAQAARQMPDVMCQAVIDLTDRHGVVSKVLTQACSYCQEKGWRFTFITSYQYTFFVWRVAEDRYAVTDGLLHDAAPHDLYTREVLACFKKSRLLSRQQMLASHPTSCRCCGMRQKFMTFCGICKATSCQFCMIVATGSGRNNFFLATAVVPGKPINSCKGVAGDEATAQAARQALQAIHQRGVAHGDVRADNIMVQYLGSIPQVIFIDFGHAYLHPTPEQCERELAELALALQELE